MIQRNILNLFSTIVLNVEKKIGVKVVLNGYIQMLMIKKINNPFVLNATIKEKIYKNAMNVVEYYNVNFQRVVNVIKKTFVLIVLNGVVKMKIDKHINPSVVYAMKKIYGNKEKNVLFNKKNV